MESNGCCDPASTGGDTADVCDAPDAATDGASSPVSCGDISGEASADTPGVPATVGVVAPAATTVADCGRRDRTGAVAAARPGAAGCVVGRWRRDVEEPRRPREEAAKRARLPMSREEATAVVSLVSASAVAETSVSSSGTVPTAH